MPISAKRLQYEDLCGTLHNILECMHTNINKQVYLHVYKSILTKWSAAVWASVWQIPPYAYIYVGVCICIYVYIYMYIYMCV